ncbi:MAG: glycosyltransferase family 4 protein [Saprospiraceae bacterium]
MSKASAKRVLIISYYWPPSGGSGVQRWLKFAKYLPEFDWEPIVVAPEGADYPVADESLLKEVEDITVLRYPIWEPYSLYRKLTGAKPGENFGVVPAKKQSLTKRFSTWIRANFFVPDPRVFWVKPTTKGLVKYLKDNPVDVVITTGPPHSVHLIGKALKKRVKGLKWIMDVRDPWSQFDIHLSFNPGARAKRKNERLEQECLTAADKVIGTAYSMPTHLMDFDTNKYQTITNGYDASDFQGLPSVKSKKDKFHIYHTGLLNAVRNPTAVWTALAKLVDADAGFAERLKVFLIGNVATEVKASIDALPQLKDKVTITPWMKHNELVQKYDDADLFLLCPNQSDNAKGQINGKLFEYLAAGKPVLHIGPYDADNTSILDDVHAGLTVPPGDVDGTEGALQRFIDGRFGESPHALQREGVLKFERKQVTKQLATLLDSLR